MGQYWQMVDLVSMRTIPGINYGKLGECFMCDHKDLGALLKGDICQGQHYVHVAGDDTLFRSDADTLNKNTPAVNLPNEILVKILLDVEDDVDRYCLGLACKRLFSLMEDCWLQHLADSYNCRRRLLGVGDYCEWDFLPSSCQDILRPFQAAKYDSDDSDSETQEESPYDVISTMPCIPTGKSGYDGPLESIQRSLGMAVWPRLLAQAPPHLRKHFSERPSYVFALLSGVAEAKVLYESLLDRPYSPDPWYKSENGISYVLRNHTKVFVLENPLITAFAKITPERGRHLTLEHVVLSQCCRSSDSSISMDNDISDEIANGPWAGDELDIVSERAFRMAFRSGDEDPTVWKNENARLVELMWGIGLSECVFGNTHITEELKASVWEEGDTGKTAEDLLAEVSRGDDDAAESKEKERYREFRATLRLRSRGEERRELLKSNYRPK